VRLEGLGQLKNPMTLSGIESATMITKEENVYEESDRADPVNERNNAF
jgi:hypothetical protein